MTDGSLDMDLNTHIYVYKHIVSFRHERDVRNNALHISHIGHLERQLNACVFFFLSIVRGFVIPQLLGDSIGNCVAIEKEHADKLSSVYHRSFSKLNMRTMNIHYFFFFDGR